MSEEIDRSKLEEIPQPPQHLFGLLGNLPDVEPSFPSRSFMRLRELYGPIFKLQLSQPVVFVGSQELLVELFDQDRFKKIPKAGLLLLRDLLGDGLFTSYLEEPNWGKAHRLLVPIFGPLGIRKMFDSMLDISSQMVLKWDRQGPHHLIDPADDFTRLAFDTIGLCAFNYRFNEFYSDHSHPFAQQMASVLIESGKEANRPKLANALYYLDAQERLENIRKMHQLCDEIVKDRKENPQPEVNDVLNVMLGNTDKQTGEKLSDENIRYQMATFLVAGHETTSSTLSFLWYNLTKNPEKMHKALQEVDVVVGDNVLTVDMLPKLQYIDACIKETQRLHPTISQIGLTSTKDQVLGGRYFIKENQACFGLLGSLHHDRKAWGDDVDVFRPERLLDGGLNRLPPHSFKPFGNGLRACIGRAFAEQEMVMNTALILQRFQVEMADPTYELQLKSTLTIKPTGFQMKARRRPNKSLMTGIPGGVPAESAKRHESQHHNVHAQKTTEKGKKPVTVFFGGNMGTCESMAGNLAEKGSDQGLEIDVQGLDQATENLPTDHPAIIITASYEGQPPDNARKFVSWLEQLSSGSKKLPVGTKFAVFGVGNSDWASTFHRIPKLVDELMGELGGDRIADAGFCNVKEDLVGPWEDWSEAICQALSGNKADASNATALQVSIESSKLSETLGGDEMQTATVVKNDELADTSVGPAKRHMEIRLPEGTYYTSGDYLVVLAKNAPAAVHRVLNRFGLSEDDMMSVAESKKKFLPRTPTPVVHFLKTAVELGLPVTKRQLATLSDHTPANSDERKQLETWQDETTYKDLLAKRYSLLDVLEELPRLNLPFGTYIDMLQPLTPRQYSISSSPLHPSSNPANLEQADIASITYDVQTSPTLSGHGTFEGVASNYLARRRAGDHIACFVRPTNVGFRLPADPETPLILIAAGTGIAPMRAFLQERAAIQEAGVRKLGPALLFFGCRNEEKDFIYREELAAWEKLEVVRVVPAFSRPSGAAGQGGAKAGKYVSEALWEEKATVAELFKNGGKIFLCGSAARLGRSTAEACKKIYLELRGGSEEDAEKWLQSIRTERYVSDVY